MTITGSFLLKLLRIRDLPMSPTFSHHCQQKLHQVEGTTKTLSKTAWVSGWAIQPNTARRFAPRLFLQPPRQEDRPRNGRLTCGIFKLRLLSHWPSSESSSIPTSTLHRVRLNPCWHSYLCHPICTRAGCHVSHGSPCSNQGDQKAVLLPLLAKGPIWLL